MNWLHSLYFGYLLPSLYGNGPEAIAQTVLYGAIALIFVPPIREWFERHYHSIKEHATAEADKLHARIDHTHALMQHVIEHSKDIPPFPASTKESKP